MIQTKAERTPLGGGKTTMNKEQILAKAKRQGDERALQIRNRAAQWFGAVVSVGMTVMYIVLMICNIASDRGLMMPVDIIMNCLYAILLAGWGVQSYYIYAKLKGRDQLLIGILTSSAFVCMVISAVLGFMEWLV